MTDLPDQATFTIREAAEVLRVAPETLRRQIAAGHVHAIRLGRVVRIPRHTLATMLEGDAA